MASPTAYWSLSVQMAAVPGTTVCGVGVCARAASAVNTNATSIASMPNSATTRLPARVWRIECCLVQVFIDAASLRFATVHRRSDDAPISATASIGGGQRREHLGRGGELASPSLPVHLG